MLILDSTYLMHVYLNYRLIYREDWSWLRKQWQKILQIGRLNPYIDRIDNNSTLVFNRIPDSGLTIAVEYLNSSGSDYGITYDTLK